MFAKVLLLLSALVVINCTQDDGGHSNSYREQDKSGNYKFGYHINDKYGGENSREEKGDPYGNVVGSYSLGDGHGGKRVVHYVADKSGFRAKIQTNEKGTTNEDSADAIYNGFDDKWGNNHNNQQNYDSNHNNDNNDNNYGNNYDNHNSYDNNNQHFD